MKESSESGCIQDYLNVSSVRLASLLIIRRKIPAVSISPLPILGYYANIKPRLDNLHSTLVRPLPIFCIKGMTAVVAPAPNAYCTRYLSVITALRCFGRYSKNMISWVTMRSDVNFPAQKVFMPEKAYINPNPQKNADISRTGRLLTMDSSVQP